jgi:poly-gamma-glutamate capsule biosynthesis protein CapA/YwtB (metallophosphatase superfamily)
MSQPLIPQDLIPDIPVACSIDDGFTFAAVGDMIGPVRPVMPLARPSFTPIAALLQRADIGFANHEGSVFDVDTFSGYRAAENGGGYPVSDLATADDLKAMGLDVVTKANNHATDWGTEGLLASGRALDDAGVAYAGGGASKAAARAPAFIETAKGRVAVISTATTFTPMSEAGNGDGEIGARPGISVLKLKTVTKLVEADMDVIRRAADLQGLGRSLDSRAYGNASEVMLGSEFFRVADTAGLHYEMNRLDHIELLHSIKAAKQVADLVVFSIHGHESESGDGTDRRPADFMTTLYRQAVDTGADLCITTGPHVVRGIEIYKGKPLLYGLGSFFLELEAGRGPTVDGARAMGVDPFQLTKSEFTHKRIGKLDTSWFDSVVAVTEFRGGRAFQILLTPLVLSQRDQSRVQGEPRQATGEDAQRILHQLQIDSRPFGTEIAIEGDVGVIRLS